MSKTLLELEGEILNKMGVNIPGELIAANEGFVFRVERDGGVYAFKVYPEKLSLEDIALYQELTNRLATLINGRLSAINSVCANDSMEFIWHVVPIDVISEISDMPYTISKFIEGPTVFEEMSRGKSKLCKIGSNVQIEQQLRKFSGDFNKILEIKTILLNTTNTKLHRTVTGNIMYVTDVCQEINDIRVGSNVVP